MPCDPRAAARGGERLARVLVSVRAGHWHKVFGSCLTDKCWEVSAEVRSEPPSPCLAGLAKAGAWGGRSLRRPLGGSVGPGRAPLGPPGRPGGSSQVFQQPSPSKLHTGSERPCRAAPLQWEGRVLPSVCDSEVLS